MGEQKVIEGTLNLEEPGSVGNTMELWHRDGNAVHFSIDNPWAGDTETGFGATTHIALNATQVITLKAFLESWLAAR